MDVQDLRLFKVLQDFIINIISIQCIRSAVLAPEFLLNDEIRLNQNNMFPLEPRMVNPSYNLAASQGLSTTAVKA